MAQRSLTPFGGSDPILSLHREMNRLFDDVFRGGGAPRSFAPSGQAAAMFDAQMDVAETEKDFEVRLDVPGVRQEDIDINLDGDLLTIRGEKKFEQTRDDKQNYHFTERSYGAFQRALRLPFSANPEEVRAACENGVLTITIPKGAQQARSRRIQIAGSAAPALGQDRPQDEAQAGGAGAEAGGERRPDDGGQAVAH
jgi:HSP20 family protein